MPRMSREELIAQYGEENAEHLMESMGLGTANYTRYLWISSEVGDFPEYREATRRKAEQEGKRYEETDGSVSLIQRALDGDWDSEDFVICRPGQCLVARPASTIIDAEDL